MDELPGMGLMLETAVAAFAQKTVATGATSRDIAWR